MKENFIELTELSGLKSQPSRSIIIINVKNIIWVHNCDKYCEICLQNGSNYINTVDVINSYDEVISKIKNCSSVF